MIACPFSPLGTVCEVSTKAFPTADDEAMVQAMSADDRVLLHAGAELGRYLSQERTPGLARLLQ
jgi:hypothetical protein